MVLDSFSAQFGDHFGARFEDLFGAFPPSEEDPTTYGTREFWMKMSPKMSPKMNPKIPGEL